MANEWIPVELYGPNNDGGKRRVTIADGVSVSVGALLQLIDPRTASYATLFNKSVAGVAAEEHIANKGITGISVWTDGIFEATASSAIDIPIGYPIIPAGQDNTFIAHSGAAVTTASMASVMGYVLEDVSASEVVNVRLQL